MEENFRTFKLASGRKLGDLNSFEVMDFQNGRKLRLIQKIKLRLIQKIQAKDGGVMLQLGQLDQPPMDAINNGADVVSEVQNHNLPNFQPLQIEKVTTQIDSYDRPSMDPSSNGQNVVTAEYKNTGVPIEVPFDDILKCSSMKLDDAAKKLEVTMSILKRVCRKYGIKRWSRRYIEKVQPSPAENRGQTPQIDSDLPPYGGLGLSWGQQTLLSLVRGQRLQNVEGEPSTVPIMHSRGGDWLDAYFSYIPTSEKEETINKSMKDGFCGGEFVDGGWISNSTILDFSEMLGFYLPCCHFFVPHFMESKKWRLRDRISLSMTEKIFFPVLRNNHWMLLVIDVKRKYFLWLDSLRRESEKEYAEDFARILNQEFVLRRLPEQNRWPIKYPKDTPIQENGNDCGVYMMAFMISLAIGDKLHKFSQAQAKRLRRTIFRVLEIWHTLRKYQPDQPPVNAIISGTDVISEAQNQNSPSLEPFQSKTLTALVDSSDHLPMDPSKNAQNVVTAERNIDEVTSSGISEGDTRDAQERKRKSNGVKIEVALADILKCSEMSRKRAAKELKVSVSTFKRVCRDYDIPRWPPRNVKNSHSFRPAPLEKQGQTRELYSNLPSNQDSDTATHIKSACGDADNIVKFKAKHEENMIKFQLSQPFRLEALQQEVVKRLKLEADTYGVKYVDEENDTILIACDYDLRECINTSKSLGNTYVGVLLE